MRGTDPVEPGTSRAECPGLASRFDDPIDLPAGARLVTLRDAAHHITALPKRVAASEPWRIATKQLIDAAEGRNFIMHARIARAEGIEP